MGYVHFLRPGTGDGLPQAAAQAIFRARARLASMIMSRLHFNSAAVQLVVVTNRWRFGSQHWVASRRFSDVQQKLVVNYRGRWSGAGAAGAANPHAGTGQKDIHGSRQLRALSVTVPACRSRQSSPVS